MSTIGANKLKQVSGGSAEFEVGDIVIYKDAVESSTTSSSFAKLKEAQTGKGGELRIKFDMQSGRSDGNGVQGRIYRNGVAVGTTRYQTSTSFITYSEDISGWSAGDLIQIYGTGGTLRGPVIIKNFNIYVDKSETII